MAAFRTTPLNIPADIIIYRHLEKLVYVKPAATYQEALDVAQKEFSEELAGVPREKILFTIVVNMGTEKRIVRISESAWAAAVARLLRGEIIDVEVRTDSSTKSNKEPVICPPPQYLEVPGDKEASEFRRMSRSNPTTPVSSRRTSPTPSTRSAKNSKRWFAFS